jgi:hypothetical protein
MTEYTDSEYLLLLALTLLAVVAILVVVCVVKRSSRWRRGVAESGHRLRADSKRDNGYVNNNNDGKLHGGAEDRDLSRDEQVRSHDDGGRRPNDQDERVRRQNGPTIETKSTSSVATRTIDYSSSGSEYVRSLTGNGTSCRSERITESSSVNNQDTGNGLSSDRKPSAVEKINNRFYSNRTPSKVENVNNLHIDEPPSPVDESTWRTKSDWVCKQCLCRPRQCRCTIVLYRQKKMLENE